MSYGGTAQWRGRVAPQANAKNARRVCMALVAAPKTACGRKLVTGHVTADRDKVRCAECNAAIAADEAQAAQL